MIWMCASAIVHRRVLLLEQTCRQSISGIMQALEIMTKEQTEDAEALPIAYENGKFYEL